METQLYQKITEKTAERIKERESGRRLKSEQLDCLKNKEKFDWTKIESTDRLVERAMLLGLSEDARILLGDPTNKEIGNRIFEKIIDTNNLLDVDFLLKGSRMTRAVGRVVLPVSGGNRLGTGFMVTPQIMMTNNHVLSSSLEAQNARLEFDFFRREDGTTGPVVNFRLLPGRFYITDVNLDFTLIAVERVNTNGIELDTRGWFPLIGPSGKALAGERVSIIQHPNGAPQQVVIHDNKVVDVMENDDFLHYEADTMGGSSGSPVLNINWDLVALHHAAAGHSNEGIRISSIVRRLNEIFNQESSVDNFRLDNRLFKELLEAKAPLKAETPTKLGLGNAQDFESPRINNDGTSSWTIPITLTLGVGQLPNVTKDLGPKLVDGTQLGNGVLTDDADLKNALQALEEAKKRVYYSEVKDTLARNQYYPDMNGLSPADRYKILSDLLKQTHTTTLSYKKARLNHLYPWIDRREGKDRAIRGIYSNKIFDSLEVIRQEAEMESLREKAMRERFDKESFESVDEAFLEELEAAFPFNCEHVVPQSWFNKEKQPKADLHHLFTCEWGCNSFRGNHAYWVFGLEAFRDNCGERENGKFEPKNGKGAVARATLYFLLRYPGKVANTAKEMPMDRINILVKWATEDKVDRWERHRNAEIQKVQGNRNPLIDFPELVDKIDFKLGLAN